MHEAATELRQRDLYRLPWSPTDNPIGWVEITDICNIHCDGCYRLVLGEGHKPLEKVKEEVRSLMEWRNCDGISLAGGEPILHPHIVEIVAYITSLGAKSLILTNGYALNKELLIKLKQAGLTGVSFHIDTTQTRPEFRKRKIERETDLHWLREKYGRLLKHVGGLYAHFGLTVGRSNLHEVPEFIAWAIDHIDIVNGISLITHRGLPAHTGISYRAPDGKPVDMKADTLGYSIAPERMKEANVTSKELYALLRQHFPGYEAAAYLNGTQDHSSYKWLLGNLIADDRGHIFGGYGARTMELVQTFHHLRYGNYLVYPKIKMGRRIFFMGLFDPKVSRAWWRYFRHLLGNPLRIRRPVKAIGIGMIQAPDVLPDGRVDMCDSCPDVCIHEGQLVNSCRLDECRKFGGLLTLNVMNKEGADLLAR